MKKNKKRIKAFFTITPELYERFNNHIDEKLLDKSKLIEKLIEDYMEKL